MRTLKVIYFVFFIPAIIFAGWSAQNSGVSVNLRDIYFVDISNGWCVGEQGTVLHTTNGGITWIIQNGNTNASAYHEGVSAASPTTAWFVGNYPYPPDSDIIRKTTDGGNTWFPCTSGVHNPAGVGWSGVHFVDANNGWVCSGGPVGGGYDQIILHTTNGGNTFSQPRWENYDGGLVRIFFIDVLHGWACGGTEMTPYTCGYVISTNDGGISWQLSDEWPAQTPFTYPLYSGISAASPLLVWTCSSLYGAPRPGEIVRQIEHATDGGNSWDAQLVQTVHGEKFDDIHFVNNLRGWVVGTDIWRTNDGGTSWVLDTSGISRLKAVHFVDATNGWACGYNGTILKYTGAGTVEENIAVSQVNIFDLILAPVNKEITFSISSPKAAKVTISLFNVTGQRIILEKKNVTSGISYHHLSVSPNLSSGTYFLKAETADKRVVKKIVVIR